MTDEELAEHQEMLESLCRTFGADSYMDRVLLLIAEVKRLRSDRDHARHWANYAWGGVDGLVSRGDAFVAAIHFCGDPRQGGTNVSAADGWRVGQPVG